MRKKELYEHVLAYFERTMDATETELHFSNPFELLVAVVLSAQCTDKRINQVTPRLFADFPVPEAMAATTPEVIYDYIKSVSYPNNKAKHLVGLAKMLVERFGGEVPSTLEELTQLPGVGRKTALRFALHLLAQDKEAVHAFSNSLTTLCDDVKHCKVCHNISDTEICDICANPQRDRSTICVVENIHSVMSIENTGQYHGLYHVLGGVISPMDGVGPSDLELESLFERVKAGNVNEIILALNPTMEGDTTNFYISRRLADSNVKLSVLARGVSIGDDLEYTDEVTLGRSILARTPLK